MDRKMQKSIFLFFVLILVTALSGCGGGGGGSSSGGSDTNPPPVGSPSQEVLPTSYNFGSVTIGNSPTPLEVKIKNNGSADLKVSSIVFSSSNGFSLDFSGGSTPCATSSPTVGPGNTCTFEVGFQPASAGSFSANVQISSNDGASPTTVVKLSGVSEPVSTLNLRINQIETSCPSNEAEAYVSLTDQAGYPLTGLTQANFSIVENSNPLIIKSSQFVSQIFAPISIVAVMDYSGSITDTADAIQDMENGLVAFVDDLAANDEMEIIKFDSLFEIVQPFTSDIAALKAAIVVPFDKGIETRLYDSVYQAVSDAGSKIGDRRAVIVITDGNDSSLSGGQLSSKNLDDVIALSKAKGVPIFPIAINSAEFNVDVLRQMADQSGGQLFDAPTSDNLRNIYQQLSSVLFENQYVLTFDQLALGNGVAGNLTIEANSQGIKGNYTRLITSCN